MPPKKRTSTRRAGASVARPTGKQPYILNAPATNPVLPDIPAKNSFAYGSSTTAILPRKITVQPKRGLAEIAKTIEEGVKEAEDRANESTGNTSRPQPKPKSPSPEPVRRSMREPTPDQQLFDNLREATQSPHFPDDVQSASTPTPTPPIPHTLSTVSSPTTQNFARPTDTLYPSPMMRFGSAAPNLNSLSSPQFQSSLDNESVISFKVERDIHEDNLQRTRGNTFRDELQGQTISAPPRRFSGLAFANEVIEEEDEPPTRLSLSQPRSPEPAPPLKPEPQSDPETSPEPEPEPYLEPGPEPEHVLHSAREHSPAPVPPVQPEPRPQASWQAAKSIIPDRIVRSLSRDPSVQASSKRASSYRQTVSPPPVSQQPPQRSHHYEISIPLLGTSLKVPKTAVQTAVILCLTAVSILTVMNTSCCVGWRFPFGASNVPLNATNSESVKMLTHHVVRLGNEMSSLSKEIQMIKSEAPQATTIIERVSKPGLQHQDLIGTNFFSHGMGAIINPHTTSPTFIEERNYFQKVAAWMLELRYGRSQPALQALLPWEDVGDCWCSALREDGMAQLGVDLGRPAVPSEVVVEHIPRRASVAPERAPKEMELWAQFVFLEGENAPNTYLSREGDTLLANGRTLHENLMEPLRFAYRDQPDSAFSDDPLLGSTFYRIGRWTYNAEAPNHVQRYTLDATIDIAGVRVDRVVLRMKSNWGSNETTCLYRVRLHGHL